MERANRPRSWVLSSALVAACAGAPPAEAPRPSAPGGGAPGAASLERPERDAAARNGAPEPPGQGGDGLPATCTRVDDLCLPPRAFVQRLCQDAYVGAALHLFAKSSPFSRGYVRGREIRAVNTLGGPSSDVSLRFGEEVVLLTRSAGEAPPGGFQVSGMGGYDVLRWDGTCANLSDGELALRPQVPPRYAPLSWRYLDTNIQNALLLDAGIEAARREHKKHCHGVSLGRISAACAKAETDLGDRIVAAVRGGIALPVPEHMP